MTNFPLVVLPFLLNALGLEKAARKTLRWATRPLPEEPLKRLSILGSEIMFLGGIQRDRDSFERAVTDLIRFLRTEDLESALDDPKFRKSLLGVLEQTGQQAEHLENIAWPADTKEVVERVGRLIDGPDIRLSEGADGLRGQDLVAFVKRLELDLIQSEISRTVFVRESETVSEMDFGLHWPVMTDETTTQCSVWWELNGERTLRTAYGIDHWQALTTGITFLFWELETLQVGRSAEFYWTEEDAIEGEEPLTLKSLFGHLEASQFDERYGEK